MPNLLTEANLAFEALPKVATDIEILLSRARSLSAPQSRLFYLPGSIDRIGPLPTPATGIVRLDDLIDSLGERFVERCGGCLLRCEKRLESLSRRRGGNALTHHLVVCGMHASGMTAALVISGQLVTLRDGGVTHSVKNDFCDIAINSALTRDSHDGALIRCADRVVPDPVAPLYPDPFEFK